MLLQLKFSTFFLWNCVLLWCAWSLDDKQGSSLNECFHDCHLTRK